MLSWHAEYRLGLSATPIYNYGSEIHTILQYLDPYVLGDWEDFCREWLGSNNVERFRALGTYLREQHVYLRRTKAEVGQQMPALSRIVETVAWDQDRLDGIEDLARQLAIKADTGSFVERGQAARELDLRVRHATGVAKARGVARYVRLLLEAGERVLLAGWHRDVYDIWLEELAPFKPALYTGSESPAQKERVRQAAMAGDVECIILSLRSDAGLDGLQYHFSTVVFGELDWSQGIHEQVIGRLDREGQTQQVTAIFLVAEDGSDPPMIDLLGLKASQARAINDPPLGVEQVVSDGTKLQKLAERYLDKRTREALAAASARGAA